MARIHNLRVFSDSRIAASPRASSAAACVIGLGLLTFLNSTSCSLDASGKRACDTQSDCLGGYVCTDHECVGEHQPIANERLTPPSELTGNMDPSSLEYRVSWRDNTDDETGFEIEQRLVDTVSSEELGVISLRTLESNVTTIAYRFLRVGTHQFRVRAVRVSETSLYSGVHTHDVDSSELYPWDETKVPSTPQAEYTYFANPDGFTGAVELQWSDVDFREEEAAMTGYRVYRREASFISWTLCKALPASVRFYRDERSDGGFMNYEYAVAAHNSFGESRYWTHSEGDETR